MDLIQKRGEIIAEHQQMEKYHPHWKAEAAAGRSISARPIAFLCDDEVVVIGEDVAKVLDGLKKFVAKAPDYAERAKREPAVAQAIAKCTKAVAGAPPAEIRVTQQVWNGYLFGLGEMGVEVVLSEGGGA